MLSKAQVGGFVEKVEVLHDLRIAARCALRRCLRACSVLSFDELMRDVQGY